MGGAVGSSLAGIAAERGGWPLVCTIGAGFGALALVTDFICRRT